ncbi:MAG TPA: hypothetical protein VNU68_30455 [Verrucomicrobiae bacterium]|nr:hypothetical protein [Verrucomicrobiae bacterium]
MNVFCSVRVARGCLRRVSWLRSKPATALGLAACVGLALALVWSAGGASAPSGQEAFRKLLKLPVLHAEFTLRLDPEAGYVLSGGMPDQSAEIERLNHAMQEQPADAERQFALFEIYRQMGQSARATNHLARAVTLFRTLADMQSENAALLAKYGRALDLASEDKEAEAVLRRSIRLGPMEWRGWSALGQLQLGKCLRTLTESLPAGTANQPQALLAAAIKKEIAARQLHKARGDLEEALRSTDRAVALAPKEVQPLADRALVHAYVGMLHFIEDVLGGAESDALKLHRAMFPTNALIDLQAISRLTPEDPVIWGKIGLFRLLDGAVSLGQRGAQQLSTGDFWSLLTDSQRRDLQRVFTALENLSQSGNPAVAAAALDFLGAFQWTAMRDRRGAERSLRRAIQLDPRREMAWDFLMAVLIDADRNEEAVSAAEARLQTRDTVRNRVAAAKACDRAGRSAKAQAHLEAALKLDREDYLANFAGAIMVLKSARDEEQLRRAGSLLERAGRVEGRPATRDEWLEWTTTSAIYYALNGNREAARREFKRALAEDSANQTAKDGLALVGP